MIQFSGRTAFVTGGANGVGIGLVRALLNEGCKVAIADIRDDHIDRAIASLDNREVMGVKVDVSSRDGMARAVARRWTSREVRTRVLPVPAPASTSTGPSSASTASRCTGFSPARCGKRRESRAGMVMVNTPTAGLE